MGKIKIILLSVFVLAIIGGSVYVTLQFGIANSDVGARLIGQTINSYVVDRSVNMFRTIDVSETHLANFGYLTDKSFSIDVDAEKMGVPNINTKIIYDSVPCDKYGNVKNDFEYIGRNYYDAEGNHIVLNQVHIKTQIQVEIEAYFYMTRQFGISGWCLEIAYGEIEGGFTPYFDKDDYMNFGGKPAKGVIALQLYADKIVVDELEKEDYVFMKTAIIDVECVKRETLWHIRGGEYVDPYATASKPVDNGYYNLYNTVYGDLEFYATVDEALSMIKKTSYNPSFETISLDDIWKPYVYVSIPYDTLMGAKITLAGGSKVKANNFEYTQRFSNTYDIVYTVLTGYSSLDIDPDVTIYTTNNEYDDTLGEKILAWLASFFATWYGKVIVFGGILTGVGGGFISYKKSKNKKEQKDKPDKKKSNEKKKSKKSSGSKPKNQSKYERAKKGTKKALGKAKESRFFKWIFEGEKRKK